MNESDPPLDEQLRETIEGGRAADLPPWHTMSVEEARRIEDEVFSAGDGPEMATITDRRIDGPAGSIPVRIYTPLGTDRRVDPPPALVFYHGGGWTLGTLDSADDLCREFARRLGAIVVSVDYRLAPEHPFPAPVEDAWAALEWVTAHAEEIGADPDIIAVGGTSAGGGLAAATALRARDEGIELAAQLLWYPMLVPAFDGAWVDIDVFDGDHTDLGPAEGDAPLLSRADIEWFWSQYLPAGQHLPGSDSTASPDHRPDLDPLAAPLLADDLSGVAPAVIGTGGHDTLAPEAAAYAERLRTGGVDTEHRHYPRLAHGFLSFTDEVDRADRAASELTEAAVTRLTR